jgi:perosamine synthetase
MSRIPLSVPSFKGNEWQYVKECLDTEWVSSAGKYVDLFEQKIAEYTGSKYAVACVNGTSALQVSLRLVGVEAGDDVIVPTLTFIAPVNAVAYSGASPIFMDSDEYYNIDAEKTIQFIKEETVFKNGFSYNKTNQVKISAIIPVHVWGNADWLDELMPLCQERNIAVVEDASESLGTIYNDGENSGKHTGTVGEIGCLSFNGNKIITTGGGGMILTDDPNYAERAKYLTTQAKDDPVRYIHNEVGYNFRLTNIQAALGVAQLEQLPDIFNRKQQIHKSYIKGIENLDGLSLDKGPKYARNNHWLNLLQVNTGIFGETPEQLMNRLEENNIQTRPVWALNHLQKPYRKFQSYKIEKAEELFNKSLCLPSSSNLTNENLNKIVSQLNG